MTDPALVGPLQLQRLALGQIAARVNFLASRVPALGSSGGRWAGPARDAYDDKLRELARLAHRSHDAVLAARDCVDRALVIVANDVH